MDDETLPFEKTRDYTISRRGFAALSLGAVASVSAMAADAVTETDITVKMADGNCDAAVFHPSGEGRWPAIVIFTDALGLRPAFRDMGKRLAAEGYAVIVPNPFYRTRKAPVLSGPFDFGKPEDRAKLVELTAPLNNETKTRDAMTYIAYLDALPQVKTASKIGVVGYCMGGAYTVLAAAASPGRIGAGVSLHGGNLVTDKPDSPHLLIPKVKASYYFGVATNDDQRQPDAKDKLREAFAAANVPAKIEVYQDCQHGWCVADGMVYNKVGAERAYVEEIALYKKALS
jgi:carboxymethylenebutenolidase